MLPENITAVVARNELWQGTAASEPYEAGWAREAVIFVRALKEPKGRAPLARVQISPDGMHWLDEGSTFIMPSRKDEVVAARVSAFGNWLRVATDFDDGAECIVIVTIHLKA